MAWHDRPLEAVCEELDADAKGLDSAAVERRRAAAGPNELTTGERRGPLRVFLDQFASALVGVLFLAAALSVAVGHVVDATLIAVILLANGVFGFAQEYRAERSLASLREMTTPEATVRRDGETRTVPVTDLVPGDVVSLAGGDVVPADCRLLSAGSLEVDEATLTGESLPVEKAPGTLPAETPLAERSNLVYRGTHVTRGHATALVVATGMDTEVGDIAAALLDAEETRTPLQRDLDVLGRRLGVGVVALAAVVVPLLVVRGIDPVSAGLAAVSLAVAAIPEGLPAVVTLTLALGVRQMARENALVRTLPAVEALGAVDVVCTDKTGTLTEGEMRVRAAWVYDEELAVGDDDERLDTLFRAGALCNDATAEAGDPTERALVDAAREHGLDVAALRESHPRVDERPFSSERKRMATVHEDAVYVKGAPAVVLEHATRVLGPDGPEPLDRAARERIEAQIAAFADDALRVLGFAYGDRGDDDPESDLVFVGLQGLMDPPRPEVADAVADTRRAGIDVKMITGDNARTARAVARQVGLGGDVLTGADVADADDEWLRERVEEVDVFARAEPVHKVRVLRALQANGHAVAMTGDGVNDAPALKSADVGIAMGVRGTDVAKQASDVVLLDDDYATIRDAIRRGRTIFDNVWKFVAYLLSANLAEVSVVFLASLAGYLVLPAVQLLWINLLTDGLPALALGTDPAGDVMERRPRRPGSGVVDRSMLAFVAGAGAVATALMLALTWYALDGAPATTPYATTMVFTGFVVFEFVKLYAVRWTRETPLASNPWLASAVVASLAAHLAVLYTPLGDSFGTVPLTLADWGLLGAVVVVGAPMLVLAGVAARRRAGRGVTPAEGS